MLKIANACWLFVTNRIGMLFPVKLFIEHNKIIEFFVTLSMSFPWICSTKLDKVCYGCLVPKSRPFVSLWFSISLLLTTTTRLVWGLLSDFLWWCWYRTQYNTLPCHRHTNLIAECTKHWGRSFTSITNSNGPSKELRGTPKSRVRLDDNSFPYWTVCERAVR